MRKIVIYTSRGRGGEIQTDVKTFRELKPLLLDRDINLSQNTVLESVSRNTLQEDSALLPTGDFKVWIVPKETKSGASARNIYDSIQARLDGIEDLAGDVRGLVEDFKTALKKENSPLSEEDKKEMEEFDKLLRSRGSSVSSSYEDDDYDDDEDENDVWA